MSGYLRKVARKRLKANRGLMNRTRHAHLDVLQNVEWALVTAWRESPHGVDDRACHAGIQSALTGQPAPGPASAMLAGRLAALRLARSEVSDDTWRDALAVVAQSVRRPGETDYLAFAGAFIPAGQSV